MKTVVATDLHLGDPKCWLTQDRNAKADRFVECFGKECDYLILAGDVFDIAVADIKDVFDVATGFFNRLRELKLEVRQAIVYMPGNHDFDLWETFQRHHNVVGNMRAFQWSIPGVFSELDASFLLPGRKSNPQDYDVPFLRALTGFRTILAYPNLYYVRAAGDIHLITHGHYFDGYWSLLGNAAAAVDNTEMKLDHPPALSLEELVQFNFPLNQLTCTGVGQVGKLTGYVRWLQAKVYGKEFSQVDPDLWRLTRFAFQGRKGILEHLWKPLAQIASFLLLRHYLKESDSPRDMKEYLKKQQGQIGRFLDATRHEMQTRLQLDPSLLRHVTFGHTHDPIPAQGSADVATPLGDIPFSNTGGWLKGGAGAEVHVYESGKPLWSVRVSGE